MGGEGTGGVEDVALGHEVGELHSQLLEVVAEPVRHQLVHHHLQHVPELHQLEGESSLWS